MTPPEARTYLRRAASTELRAAPTAVDGASVHQRAIVLMRRASLVRDFVRDDDDRLQRLRWVDVDVDGGTLSLQCAGAACHAEGIAPRVDDHQQPSWRAERRAERRLPALQNVLVLVDGTVGEHLDRFFKLNAEGARERGASLHVETAHLLEIHVAG